MPFVNPELLYQERLSCSVQAAAQYHIPPLVMLAVAEQEGGKPGQQVHNRNRTVDYGAMQINSVMLKKLQSYGITEQHVLASGCYPYLLAAWRLSGHLRKDQGDLWQRAANYHSRTSIYNQRYRRQLIARARQILGRLTKNGNTRATAKLLNMDLQFTEKPRLLPQMISPTMLYAAPIRVTAFDTRPLAVTFKLPKPILTQVQPAFQVSTAITTVRRTPID
jgi:hypothetical protein